MSARSSLALPQGTAAPTLQRATLAASTLLALSSDFELAVPLVDLSGAAVLTDVEVPLLLAVGQGDADQGNHGYCCDEFAAPSPKRTEPARGKHRPERQAPIRSADNRARSVGCMASVGPSPGASAPELQHSA